MDESLGPRVAGAGHGVRIVFIRLLVAAVVALALAAPVQAGLFKKSAKPDPAVHVPALIETLKTNKEEKARAAAAGELDEYDAKAFPDILPALIEALATDASPSVRSRAAESIGKVRPITAMAGYALERASADDKSFSVRVSARAALVKYRVLGHMPGAKIEGVVQSAEPPLAAGPTVKDTSTGTVLRPTPAPVPVDGPLTAPALPPPPAPKSAPDGPPQTGEPPLAKPAAPPAAAAPVIVIPSTPPASPPPTTPTSAPTGPVLPPKD